MAEKILDYPKGYYDSQVGSKHPIEDLILEFVKKGDVLDVGCGAGQLLEALKNRFEVEGFDPSQYAIEIAKKKGLKVKVSTIKNFNPKKRYKTIIMNGVIAHLYDKGEDFKKVLSWLDDDGELIITVPNSSSPFFKRHQSHLWTPSFQEFKGFIKENNLRIKTCIGAGRLRYLPYLSSIVFYVLVKNEI